MSDLQRVGPDWGGQGTFKPLTTGPSGAQRVADAHARYMQAVLEGRVYSLDSDSVTVAAAHVTKSAMGTVKFINGFLNPVNSNKLAVLWRTAASLTSGTPGGALAYNMYPAAGNVTSAATGTIRNQLTFAATGSAMRPLVNVALAVLPADTAALVQVGVAGGPAAVAAGAGVNSWVDEPAGSIIIEPGFFFGLTSIAAGTSPIFQTTLVWEEIPYPTAILVP